MQRLFCFAGTCQHGSNSGIIEPYLFKQVDGIQSLLSAPVFEWLNVLQVAEEKLKIIHV